MNFIREFFKSEVNEKTGMRRVSKIRETKDGTQHAQGIEELPREVTKSSRTAPLPGKYLTEASLNSELESLRAKVARLKSDHDKLQKENDKLKP